MARRRLSGWNGWRLAPCHGCSSAPERAASSRPWRPPTGTPTLSPPTTAGGGFTGGGGAASHTVHGDDKQVAFSTSDQAPGPGEAHVYRVSASQNGVVFGGYTIVVMG